VRAARVVALAVAAALAGPALAAPGKGDEAVLATKAAMDAFFALDGAVPRPSEGDAGWPPAETDDHDDVIASLDEALARGARLDRYRWHGTLLHHSLRAGFGDVTRWLLAHGADPLQRIQGDGDLDALGEAVHLQRWNWVRTLLRHPAYRRLPAAEVSKRLWAGATTEEKSRALLSLKLKLPKPAAPDMSFLATALQARDAAQVDRLLAAQPGRQPLNHAIEVREPRMAEVWPLQRWRQLDARLQLPVLPWALARASTEADVRALLAAGLRAPWNEPRFVTDVARLLPASSLPGLLLRPPAGADLGPLWAAVARERIPDLRRLPLQDWRAHVMAAPSIEVVLYSLSALPQRLPAGPDSVETEDRRARWAPVVERLRAVPPARRRELWLSQWRLDTQMGELPSTFMPEFVAWAAADGVLVETLPHFVKDRQPADYELLWPALRQQAPALADELLPALLSRLWVDPPRSRLADAMTGWGVGDAGLARWLLPRSPRVAPHRLRAGLVADGAGWRDADLVRWAVAEGLALRPEPAAAAAPRTMPGGATALRQVTAPLDCTTAVSPGLRRALAQLTLEFAYDPEKLGWVQPVAAPRQAQCQWLRSSETVTGGGWSDESFFDGFTTHMAHGSIEQTLNVERWDEAAQRFVPVQGFSFVTQLLEVELLPRGERFWLGTQNDANGRRGPSGFALSWPGDKPVFDGLAAGSALDDGWRSLIDPETGDVPALADEGRQAAGPRDPVAIGPFVGEQWAEDKRRFLAAFAALDREALAVQRRAGLPAPWLDEAVLALSADHDQPLEARRHRMAWLLALPAYVDSLQDGTLDSLRDWLPAEDWGPILASRRCRKYSLLNGSSHQELSRWALEAPPALRHRIEVAVARDCDGEVR